MSYFAPTCGRKRDTCSVGQTGTVSKKLIPSDFAVEAPEIHSVSPKAVSICPLLALHSMNLEDRIQRCVAPKLLANQAPPVFTCGNSVLS